MNFCFVFPHILCYEPILCMSCACPVPVLLLVPPLCVCLHPRNDLLGLEGRMVAMSPDDSSSGAAAELANGGADHVDHHETEKRCLFY